MTRLWTIILLEVLQAAGFEAEIVRDGWTTREQPTAVQPKMVIFDCACETRLVEADHERADFILLPPSLSPHWRSAQRLDRK